MLGFSDDGDGAGDDGGARDGDGGSGELHERVEQSDDGAGENDGDGDDGAANDDGAADDDGGAALAPAHFRPLWAWVKGGWPD